MPRESSSPEDGHGGQVRVKVNSHADHKLMIRIRELSLLIVSAKRHESVLFRPRKIARVIYAVIKA